MDEPKVEATGRTSKVQYLVIYNGQILYAISNRKMAVRLCDQIKEGDSPNHGKESPSGGSTTKPPPR